MSGAFDRLRFAAGDSYAVVGEDVLVVLPGSARSRVAAVWEAVDDGASADEVLDVLVSSGLSRLGDLALVSLQREGVRVLVRGSASATLRTTDGTEVVRASPGTVWSERVLPEVTGLRVGLDADAEADARSDLPLGLVRVSAVEHGVLDEAVVEPETGTTEPEPEPETGTTEPEPQPEPQPASQEPGVPAEMIQVPPTWDSADDLSDRDGQTVVGEAVPPFQRPDIPGQEHAPAVLSQPVASLVFSTGDVIEVDRTVLVGRAPEARRFALHDQPRTVTVPSPQQEISSTHLEIRPGAGADHGSAIVTDLGSTNGTVLVQPGLPQEDLQPGIAVSLIPGAVLDLGDGVTIQVTNA